MPHGTPPHSWQWVATGKSSVVHKGLIAAGKVIAMTALDILEDMKLLDEAKREHMDNLGGEQYVCMIPEDVIPG
jgi:aminobenzoyl-glutamate utilization protein B